MEYTWFTRAKSRTNTLTDLKKKTLLPGNKRRGSNKGTTTIVCSSPGSCTLGRSCGRGPSGTAPGLPPAPGGSPRGARTPETWRSWRGRQGQGGLTSGVTRCRRKGHGRGWVERQPGQVQQVFYAQNGRILESFFFLSFSCQISFFVLLPSLASFPFLLRMFLFPAHKREEKRGLEREEKGRKITKPLFSSLPQKNKNRNRISIVICCWQKNPFCWPEE